MARLPAAHRFFRSNAAKPTRLVGAYIAKLPDYDGILVLHGTDTMAYTANLFALSLQGLDKPVILTGSQWPYDAANSDASRNLATAVSAFSLKLKQVVIAFDGKLFPSVGSSKVSTETAAGFDNLHFGTLAEWEENKGWHNIHTAPTQHSDGLKPRLPNPEAKVSVRTLIPGYAAQELSDGLPQLSAQALILQSYGHGNAPSTMCLSEPSKPLRNKANCCSTSAKYRKVVPPPSMPKAMLCVR